MKLSEKLAGYAQHIDSYPMALDIADAGREAAKLEEKINDNEYSEMLKEYACDDCSLEFLCDKHWEEFTSKEQESKEKIEETPIRRYQKLDPLA